LLQNGYGDFPWNSSIFDTGRFVAATVFTVVAAVGWGLVKGYGGFLWNSFMHVQVLFFHQRHVGGLGKKKLKSRA